jgi:hypothetical protein
MRSLGATVRTVESPVRQLLLRQIPDMLLGVKCVPELNKYHAVDAACASEKRTLEVMTRRSVG